MMMVQTVKNSIITTIDDNIHPRTFRELLGYLKFNNGRDCFSKSHGKVYMITKEGDWSEVCRNVSDLSYRDYLKLSIN